MSKRKDWHTERISQTVLYGAVGISTLVFGLFWLVGFDRPSLDNPDNNDPLFTQPLLALLWVMLAVALAITVWSVVRSGKQRSVNADKENNVPVRKIGMGILCTLPAIMLLTLLGASSEPMKINGAEYTDSLWLMLSDVLLNTSLTMLLLAVCAVLWCAGVNRANHKKEKTK